MILNSPLNFEQQIFGILIAFAIAIIVLFLTGFFRKLAWKKAVFQGKGKCRIAEWFNDKWGWVLLILILLFFIYWIFVIAFIFGEKNLIQGIVVGSVLTVFTLFQLPRLLKPHAQITLLKDWQERLGNLEEPRYKLELIPNEYQYGFLHITNIGINVYENWEIHLTFSKESKIEIDKEWLREYDRDNPLFSLRYWSRNNALIYRSKTQAPFGVGPNLAQIIEFKVKIPEKVEGQNKEQKQDNGFGVDFSITSSTRWGPATKKLYLIPKKEHNS